MPGQAAYDGPICDWVYFATPAQAYWTVTKDVVEQTNLIICHVYNKNGIRLANVARMKPGDTILLVYGGHGEPYHALFSCKIAASDAPVQDKRYLFDVFSYADKFADRLKEGGYGRDPILGRFTGISIEQPIYLRRISCPIPRPAGLNTIRRWDEVWG